MIKKIILVFKTHFDIGFTDLAENVIDKYATSMLDQVLETCEATADMGRQKYVWTMPSWPLAVMLQRSSGSRKERLEKLIDQGQIVWHALPFTSHFDFCGLQDYRYGFKFARQLSRQWNKPFPISAKMTDVPGHGAMLPSLLAEAGVCFLHLGSNEFLKPPKVPDLFFWEAPDGRRVLTMYSRGYGSGPIPPEDWPYPVWMAMMHTHDNCGPQSADMIRGMVEELGKKYPGAEIVCGTMDEFCRDLEQEDLSGVPVIRQDLADTWIHGVGSYPGQVRAVRQVRRAMNVLEEQYRREKETLSQGQRDQAEGLIRECYENLMLFGEHTWGLDVKTWMDPNRAYCQAGFLEQKESAQGKRMEASWKEQADRAVRAEDACRRFGELLNSCGIKAASEKEAVLAAEEGSSGRKPEEKLWQSGSGVVESRGYRLEFAPDTGEILSLEDKRTGRVLLAARRGMPAVYYRYDRYGIEDMTRYLRKMARRFSDWGIRDNGKDNYPECDHKTAVPALDHWEIRDDRLLLVYRNDRDEDTYGNAGQVTLAFRLGESQVELEVQLTDKAASPYTESGSLVLNLPMDYPVYGINKNGYVLNPETDIADWGNHALYCLENFVTASDREAAWKADIRAEQADGMCTEAKETGNPEASGEKTASAGENANGVDSSLGGERKICVVTADAPLVALGETGIYRFRKKYKAKEPALYFNLFNNMWGTNFPQWIEGDYSFRFLIFDAAGRNEEELRTQAEERLRLLDQETAAQTSEGKA